VHNDDFSEAADATPSPDAATGPLSVGTKVYVCDRFVGGWSGGFEVAAVMPAGYRLRRISDGQVFPDVFSPDEVRPDRRRHDAPWSRPDLSTHRRTDGWG